MRPKRYVLLLLFLASCTKPMFKSKWTQETAPEHFAARFETTKGPFEIEATRQWSPKAVDRVYSLLKHGFYDSSSLYRVIPNFVAQFANIDRETAKKWKAYPVPDEPVMKQNEKGTMAFARGAKDSRFNALFINLKNNSPRLDTLTSSGVTGYPVFAVVTKGMDVVELFYSGYGEKSRQAVDTLKSGVRAFLETNYPQLDYIRKAYLIKKAGKN